MTNPVYQRYALDETGTNPDNLVTGEEIVLSDRRYRCAVPKHGPFFVESLRVYDSVTLQELTKLQYSIPMISQEATLRFGKAVADSFIIEDETVSSKALVTYQAVGGLFQNNIANVVSIFETFLNDNRSIDWMTGVFGKPNQYPPTQHSHSLADLFGFEALTYVLEQIKQAILLGNTPAYEAIFQALMNNTASYGDIDTGAINSKVVPLNVLQHSNKYYNHNTYRLTPVPDRMVQDRILPLVLESSWPQFSSEIIYWKIAHIDTTPMDFVINSGSFQLTRGQGNFNLQSTDIPSAADNRRFQIVFYRGGIDKVELFRSMEILLKKNNGFYLTWLNAMTNCCGQSPTVPKNPASVAANRGIWKQIQS
jgi:hypothetical protein